MSVPLDQPITSTFLVYSDPARTTLADATTVVVDVTDPTGAVTTYSLAGGGVTRASLGTYTLAYTPATAGHYALHWRSGGTVATSQDDSFDVEAKFATWLSLSDVKAHLNITDTRNDDELRGYIDAGVEIVEGLVGDVVSTPHTDAIVTDPLNPWPYHTGTWPRYTYGVRSVDLRHSPVLAVSSVIVASMDGTNAVTLASSSYRVDQLMGTVTVIDGSAFGPLVTVTYTAGRAAVPAGVRLAALLLVEHLWEQTQRGNSTGRPTPGAEPDSDLPYGRSKESQALALLDRYRPAATVA